MYKDIVLIPYGDPNTFVFEDNTKYVYNDLKEEQEEIQQAKDQEAGWKKVIVSYDEESARNHKLVASVEMGVFLSESASIKEMKKKAYEMGCTIIIITQKPSIFNGNKIGADYYQ